MYDDHFEQFMRHSDVYNYHMHDDFNMYDSYMHGEHGVEGALPVDCSETSQFSQEKSSGGDYYGYEGYDGYECATGTEGEGTL